MKTCPPVKTTSVAPPTAEELAEFHASLARGTQRPVVHRVMDEFTHEFIPVAATEKFPVAMITLYDPDSLRLTYPELLTKCADIAQSLKVSQFLKLSSSFPIKKKGEPCCNNFRYRKIPDIIGTSASPIPILISLGNLCGF